MSAMFSKPGVSASWYRGGSLGVDHRPAHALQPLVASRPVDRVRHVRGRQARRALALDEQRWPADPAGDELEQPLPHRRQIGGVHRPGSTRSRRRPPCGRRRRRRAPRMPASPPSSSYIVCSDSSSRSCCMVAWSIRRTLVVAVSACPGPWTPLPFRRGGVRSDRGDLARGHGPGEGVPLRWCGAADPAWRLVVGSADGEWVGRDGAERLREVDDAARAGRPRPARRRIGPTR